MISDSVYINLQIVPNYNAIIAEFQTELATLTAQRDQLEKQIATIKIAIEAVQDLADETDNLALALDTPPLKMDSQEGFTDRVRAMLKANPAYALTAIIIRDEFLKSAPDEDAKTLLIHTHNTLKRLYRQGEVEEIPTSAGRGYRWRSVTANAYGELLNSPEMKEKVRAVMGRGTGKTARWIIPPPPPPPDFIEDAVKSPTKKK